MNFVKEVTAAIESSSKVVTTVFIASAAVLTLEHFYPKEFLGLPAWVLPTIKIVAIFTMALTAVALFALMAKVMRSFLKALANPIRRKFTREILLKLSLGELAIVSKAKANMDRTIWYKADMPQIVSLREKKIIKEAYTLVITGDGTSSFEFPEDVWRLIITLEEFTLHDSEPLLRALSKRKVKYSELASLLPQTHPTVQAFHKHN